MDTDGHRFLISLMWTTITVACYLGALGLKRLARHNALANPAMVTIVLVAILLTVTHTPYETYFHSTWILTFLLAPATVALGLPLAKNFENIRRSFFGVGLGLLAGAVTSMLAGVWLVKVLGGSHDVAMSMLPKAVTTPIAMAVAGEIGGQPALTATLAIVGGITAAVTLRLVFAISRIRHQHAVGLAAGTAGSGIAAAYVAAMGDGPAAFAAIGIGLNGLITALLAPLVAAMFK